MRLLHLLSWPYVRKHRLRTALTAAGVALGVAVFAAMHTANDHVLAAFAQTIDRIAGKTDLQVTAGDTGFGEDVLELVQSVPSVAVAVPVIEAVAETTLPGGGSLLVVGVDMTGDRSLRAYDLESGDEAIVDDPLVFLAQPDSIIVSTLLADRHGLETGSRITLGTAEGPKAFTVRGIMKPEGLATAFGGSLAVMDVYAAQLMFGRGRTFDRIDVGVAEGTPLEQAEHELATVLGPGFDIQPPATRGRQAEAMLAGFTTMVTLASAFALLVGMFIIYNAFATAVSQRRAEIGLLRALGASRRQISGLFLAEGAALGLIGSTAGALLGVVAAQGLGSSIGRLAGDLYGVAPPDGQVAAVPAIVLMAVAAGTLASVAAAALPARAAAQVDPVQTLRKGGYQLLSARESRVRVALAAVLAGTAVGCLAAAGVRPLFYAGYASAIAAALLVAPLASLWLAKGLRPAMAWLRPVEGALATDSLIQSPRRTSASVAALMLSLALIVAFAGLARASYGSVVEWLDTMLNPDLFVMPSARLDQRAVRFPAEMAGELAAIPGVARVQAFRNGRITFRGRPAMLAAIEMDSVAQTARARPVAGRVPDMYQVASAGRGAIVSESLAQLHGLRLGETLEIAAPYGQLRLPIAGIIVDYTDQQGTIFIDRHLFVDHWRDEGVSDFRIYVTAGTPIADVRDRIVERYAGERQLFVLTNQESRSYVLGLTDQWFGLMNIQIAIAVLVAVLGIVNSLTVSIADRRRELGVLRAVGALGGQIRRTVWLEALTVVTIGVVLGYALGAVNLFYMIEIVRRDVAGMQLGYTFPAATVLTVVPIMFAAAWLAAIWPAEAAVRDSLVEALEYE